MAEHTQTPAADREAAETTGSAPREATPATPRPPSVLRQLGNQAIQRLLAGTPPADPAGSSTPSARREEGPHTNGPGDPYEREARRVAAQVMRTGGAPATALAPTGQPAIQTLRTTTTTETARGSGESMTRAAPDLTPELNGRQGSGQPLPDGVRSFMEPRFGRSFRDVRVHVGGAAARMSRQLDAQAFTYGRNIYYGDGRSPGANELTAHELTHVAQQTGAGSSPGVRPRVQRTPDKTKTHVPHQVPVTRPMTQEEFRVAAMQQVFGRVLENAEWLNSKQQYIPSESPYTVWVDTRLLKQHRGSAAQQRGIRTDTGGGVAGAPKRAQEFHSSPASAGKAALTGEIDRRYFDAIGDKSGTKIKPGETAKAALWRMIRDEVLYQHEYISNLPPKVKALIKESTKGKVLTPADYEKLFAIAKKIEKMPAGRVQDYAGKVTGSTKSLAEFEASLDRYIAQMTAREQQAAKREKIHTKLIGLEGVYKKYKLYKTLLTSSSLSAVSPQTAGAGLVTSKRAGELRQELETELQAHNFKGVADFESFIQQFEQAFEAGAATIAKDILDKYAGKLYRESERYKDASEVQVLHQKLGGVRSQYQEFEKNAQVWNQYAAAQKKANQQRRLPGQGHLSTKDFTSITPSAAKAAQEKATAARAAAQSQVQGMAGDHPILQEGNLPDKRRIDKQALATAGSGDLGGLLQGHIQNRKDDVAKARGEIDKSPAVIYKMTKLLPVFYAQMGIQPGSIHDMIIRDKMRSDAIVKIAKGIAVAVVSIALAVVSFGTATPALLAAGAAVAGAGLGGYMAYQEYQEYAQEKHLAAVGFADDPSVAWLVIAVMGAALDAAAAVKAVSALGKAAKALDAGGDLADFSKVVRQLEKEKKITAEIARAADNAAAARQGLRTAWGDFTRSMAGKVYSFPGPLGDPDVYKAVVKLARQAIKTGVYDAQKFIQELKLARVKAGMADLSPQELAKAKEAWEEAKLLEAAETARYNKLLTQIPDATKLNTLITHAGDSAKLESLLKTFSEAELNTIFSQMTDSRRLIVMMEHLGPETTAGMVRNWMSKGKFNTLNQFTERLAGGVGKELAETSVLSGQSVIIDSNTAIALVKDADPMLKASMHAADKARVAYIQSLPNGTELRAGNVIIGEVGSGKINLKGVPLDVTRDSAAYKNLLAELEKVKLGGGSKGSADRGFVADAFFAKTQSGVTPHLVTADPNVVKKLASLAGIDVNAVGGIPALLKQYSGKGFDVTLLGRTIKVFPVP